MKFIDVLAIVAAGGLFGNELAIAAFVHPALYRLGEAPHAAAAKALARILGRLMPFWYAAVLLLTGAEEWLHRDSILIAAIAVASATIVYTITILVPINNRIASLHPTQPYAGWLEDRRSWDRHHSLRVGLLLAVFVLVIVGFLK